MRRVRWAAAIPIAMFCVAVILFHIQGGFGAGHGRFDQAIGLLGLPGITISYGLPEFLAHRLSDFVLLLAIPAAINLALWLSAVLVLEKWRRTPRT